MAKEVDVGADNRPDEQQIRELLEMWAANTRNGKQDAVLTNPGDQREPVVTVMMPDED